MKSVRIIILILFAVTSIFSQYVYGEGTTPSSHDDRCAGAGNTRWIRQLIANGFHIHDTTICYPAFPRFALKVYNWGDRTFNSYDTTYVVGTGKNWKLQGKSFNWLETSTMLFPKNAQLSMHSTLFSDAGFNLSFMAVSIGYMWNMNKFFSSPTSRNTFFFDFTCSRFSINLQSVSTDGDMIITRFGNYNDGHHIRHHFNDTRTTSRSIDAFYFFNNKRYSHGAAYSYSKYQLRSAGTAMVGFNLSEQSMSMNFSSLPPEMLEYLPLENPLYESQFRTYAAMGGYAYNWVLRPRRWLINSTGLVALGYKHIKGTRDEVDAKQLIANNFRLNIAAVYNHRALFASMTAKMLGVLDYNSNYTHFNSFMSFTLTVGMRF